MAENSTVAGVVDRAGVIVNTILVDRDNVPPDIEGVFLPPAGQTPILGGTWDGMVCHPPEPPATEVPLSISDRQFALVSRDLGLMTQEEALAFVSSGAIPAVLGEFIASLPTQAARDDAEITIAGATSLERYHPLTLALGERLRGPISLDDFLDGFFRSAGRR